MKQSLRFFATLSDLTERVVCAESLASLKYTRCHFHEEPPTPVYISALDIPDIGSTPSEAFCFCPLYIALPRNIGFHVDEVKMAGGGICDYVDPDDNPQGFYVHFGGIYQGAKLMAGSCYPYSDDDDAFVRCNTFFEDLTHGYGAVRDSRRLKYMVGPEAFELLKSEFPLQTSLSDWEILTPDSIPKRLRNK